MVGHRISDLFIFGQCGEESGKKNQSVNREIKARQWKAFNGPENPWFFSQLYESPYWPVIPL